MQRRYADSDLVPWIVDDQLRGLLEVSVEHRAILHRANGKLGAAVRAEYLRGKAAGLYDRLEHTAANEFAWMSEEELRQVIVDQAQALEALGIDLLPAPKANAKKH